MKPNRASQHLQFIVDNQKTVSTERIRKMVDILVEHNKMLEVDNKRLRRRIKKINKNG